MIIFKACRVGKSLRCRIGVTSLRLAIIVFAGLALPVGAAAQSEGLYLSGGIGGGWPQDAEYTGAGFNAEASLDLGLSASLAIGTTFGGNWRGEAELSHRVADVDAISGSATGGGDISGSSTMVNGYYDLFSGSDWRPYVGAGIGVMRLSVDGIAPVGGSIVDDDDTVAAVQGIIGMGYRLSDRIGLFTDYRFLATSDPEFRTAAGADVESEYSEHRIVIGLRWSFGGAQSSAEARPAAKSAAEKAPKPDSRRRPRLKMPPEMQAAKTPKASLPRKQTAETPNPTPPRLTQTARAKPPAKTLEASRRYFVYFDWDRWSLNDAARSIVRSAAEASTGPQTLLIRTTGHADRSGPAPYNVILSKRRAEAVEAELVTLGVPGEAVLVQWKGEAEPKTQTADGLREPLNRRVEIVLQ